VLDAQTSLTEARTTQIDAARDYLVARAQLERAMGHDVQRVNSSAPTTTVETWKPKP
jgi:outer membrane protein TolC